MSWLCLAITGLRRHSAAMLDAAGFPLWFVRGWCHAPNDWGTVVQEWRNK